MEFLVMPDHLFGASVRVNGQWLGLVEETPLPFQMKEGSGGTRMLIECTPLQTDLTGDVYPLPFARVVQIQNGRLVVPDTEPDGWLHIRRSGRTHQIFFRYPKVDALGSCTETLPLPLQLETADFDHDGRLDTVQTYFTNQCGHLRVTSATGAILLQEVYPDNGLRVEVVDINRDGRPEVLVFWEEHDVPHLHIWEAADNALTGFHGYTGIRRIGRGDAWIEQKATTPFREVIRLHRYTRKPGESPVFEFVRAEERTLQRADTPQETVEAFLSSLQIGDAAGAKLYVGKGANQATVTAAPGTFYSYEIGAVNGGKVQAVVYEWLAEGYYDTERPLSFELVQQPDEVSEWKVTRAG